MQNRPFLPLKKFLDESKDLKGVALSLSNIIQALPSSVSKEIVEKMQILTGSGKSAEFKDMILKINNKEDMESIINLFPKDILDFPLQIINENHPSKSTLMAAFEEHPEFENHFSISKKQGGANPSGEKGGVKGRLYAVDGVVFLQRMLVKQGLSIRETIGEEFLSQVGVALAEDIEEVRDIIASVYFTRDEKAEDKSKSLYISSIYLDDFVDVEDFSGVKRGKGMWGGQRTSEEAKEKLVKAIGEGEQAKIFKRTLGEIFAISLLFGNKQVHWNNIGVSSTFFRESVIKKMSGIDLGGVARREFKVVGGEQSGQFGKDVKLEPLNMKRYANYFDSYSDKLRQDPEFIKGFMKVIDYPGEKLKQIIFNKIDKIAQFCTIEEIQVFANELDTENQFIKKHTGEEKDKASYIQNIKDFMFETIYARQISLNQILFDWAKNKKIGELYKQNPIYFSYKECFPLVNNKLGMEVVGKIVKLFDHHIKELKTEEAIYYKNYFSYLLERSKNENVENLTLLACDKAFKVFSPLPFSLGDIMNIIGSVIPKKESDAKSSPSSPVSARSSLFSPQSPMSDSESPFSPQSPRSDGEPLLSPQSPSSADSDSPHLPRKRSKSF